MPQKPQLIYGFDDRLKSAILDSPLCINEICRRSGIARTTLYSWLIGGSGPSALGIVKLAPVLKVTSDYLLGIEKRPRPMMRL